LTAQVKNISPAKDIQLPYKRKKRNRYTQTGNTIYFNVILNERLFYHAF